MPHLLIHLNDSQIVFRLWLLLSGDPKGKSAKKGKKKKSTIAKKVTSLTKTTSSTVTTKNTKAQNLINAPSSTTP